MRVAEVMSRDVQVANPDQSIIEAAKLMAECDCGAIPMAQDDKLIGMITDRDIVIRALAQGKSVDTKAIEVMSDEIKYCFDDEEIEDVARNMGDLQIRRLPVVNRDKRLVGIVSLGDIAGSSDPSSAGQALSNISESSSQ
jgi:CBS domain-containing protein